MGIKSNDSVNIFALSAIPQVDYQTALVASASPKNYRQIEKTDRQFADYRIGTSDNRGRSTGSPYPNRKELETHDVTFQTTEDASSQLLGERALAGFGQVETTELEAGEVYKHVFELLNPQDNPQLPAYTLAEKAGESASRPDAHDVKYPSMVASSFSVRGSGTAKLEMSTSWVGSGKRTVPSGINFFSTSHVKLIEDFVQNFFRNTQGTFKLYPEKDLAGTAFEVACGFRDFEMTVNHNLLLQSGYQGCGIFQTAADPESGAVRGSCEIGEQQASFSFTMLMDDSYAAQAKMQTLESISADLKYTGKTITGAHKHYALFKLLAANITEIAHTVVDGKNAWRVTTEPLAQGQTLPLVLEVVNNVESYTVAADTW